MKIDDYEIEVRLVEDLVTVIIDGRDAWRDDYAHLFMTREEAMSLGGLLIGMATADGVPLVEKSEVVTQEQVDSLNRLLAIPSGEGLRSSIPLCACPCHTLRHLWESYCDACHSGGC